MKAHIYNDRLVKVEIAGKVCFLNFSLSVARMLMQRFGTTEDDTELPEATEDNIADFAEIISALTVEGEKYLRITEERTDVPHFSPDELLTILSLSDIDGMSDRLNEAIEIGSGRKVLAEPKEKNADTGQSK